jgi:hypothetical protein
MKTLALFIVALVSWTTIITQLVITTETMTNFFSYFTILSNLLVAVCSSFLLIPATSALGSFFKRTSVQTAVALYIFIVAVVYNVVLRWLFDFKGLQLVIDNFLHVVVPVLFVLYWCFFTPKKRLTWKDGLLWLIFPALYLVYSMIRGNMTHWYPYPFLNIDEIGFSKVAVNVVFMVLAFLISGMLLIWVNNVVVRKRS